jgi:hypothetical protein
MVFTKSSGDCVLFDVDRHVVAGLPAFGPKEGSDYLERNCIEGDPKRLCIYDKVVFLKKSYYLAAFRTCWVTFPSFSLSSSRNS